MSFTPRQQKFYRPLIKKAWLAHCAREKVHPESRFAYEEWYRCTLLEAVGAYTTKELNPVSDFDAVMLAFAQIANDGYWIKRCADAQERRWKFLIAERLKQLRASRAYLDGILAQMNLDQQPFDELPAEYLKMVFIALDKQQHRHRHERELAANVQ